jgi:hypothetical protein
MARERGAVERTLAFVENMLADTPIGVNKPATDPSATY